LFTNIRKDKVMTEYARVVGGIVVEIFAPPVGVTISQCFAPDVVAEFVAVPSGVSVEQGWLYANSSFTAPLAAQAPTLAQVQATQSAAMQTACKAAIEGGFTSSALGSAYTYPSDPNTQTNISLAAANGGPLVCQSSGAVWGLMTHTPAQALQVQKDMATHIQVQQTTYWGLIAEINAATAVAAVQAISWP
jgi:hypothetical protein